MPAVPPPSLRALDPKPFYAYVGAGDAALARLRTRVTALPTTLKTVPAQVQEQVKALPTLAQTLPAQAKELYADFAARGEKVVADLRGSKATTTTTTVTTPAAKPAKTV
jgi:hypothetical protein